VVPEKATPRSEGMGEQCEQIPKYTNPQRQSAQILSIPLYAICQAMFSILAILWICFNLWSTNPLNPPSLSALRLLSLIRGTYSLRSNLRFTNPLNPPSLSALRLLSLIRGTYSLRSLFPFPLKPFTFPLIPFPLNLSP